MTSSEKYAYRFDNPNIELGYVTISENNVILTFPEKVEDEIYIHNTINQNVMLHLDNQILFDYNWLPICTINDHLKCKDMLYKCYQEFMLMSHCTYRTSAYVSPRYYESLVTTFNNQNFNIYCLENMFQTSIQLEIKEEEEDENQSPIQFQIYCGKKLVFCSSMLTLNKDAVHFIVVFILYKLLKY